MAGKSKKTGRGRMIVDAIADTIIPSDGPERPGALDVELPDKLLDWLGQLPGARQAFVASCWFWEFSPILTGRFCRFTSLSFEERTALFEDFESSRSFTRRWTFFALKAIMLAVFYNDEEIWPLMGFKPGCLSEPPGKGARLSMRTAAAVETSGGVQ